MANTKQVRAANVLNNGYNQNFLGGDNRSLFGTNAAGAKQISVNAAALELSSSARPNGAAASSNVETAANQYSTESRLDVVIPEEANAAAASNATDFSPCNFNNKNMLKPLSLSILA